MVIGQANELAGCLARDPAWRAVAGIAADIGCHTFRLTGITAYLANGGAFEHTHKIGSKVENAIRASLASGKGLLKTTRELKVGSGTVERIRWAMAKQG